MTKDIELHVSMKIEQEQEVPVSLVQVALDTREENHVVVIGTNWDESDDGAAAIAALLRVTADAIEEELGRRVKPRPRFNPRPTGAR